MISIKYSLIQRVIGIDSPGEDIEGSNILQSLTNQLKGPLDLLASRKLCASMECLLLLLVKVFLYL